MITALGTVSTQQYTPTKNTMQNNHQFLDYAATHLDDIITFHTSYMVLVGYSDMSHLSESKAYSRVGGHPPSTITTATRLTMGLSSPFPKSSKPSCHPPPRLIFASSISIDDKPSPTATLSSQCDICS